MRIPIAPFAAAAFSLVAAPLADAAVFKVDTWADSQATGTGVLPDNPAPDAHDAESSTPGVSVSSSSSASLTKLWSAGSAAWSGSGNATALVDTTGIHLYAAGSAEVIDAEPFTSQAARGDGIAGGEFTDVFVLQANGIPAGTFLEARAEIVVDSVLTASASDPTYVSPDEVWGASSWSVFVRVKANGFTQLDTFFSSPTCVHRLYISPDLDCPDSSERREIAFDVPVGGVTEVYLRGNVQGDGITSIESDGSASAAGMANLSNTIGWGGILELETQSEEPVTEFSMISASTGIDYRYSQVVPEPGAATLGLSALAALGAARRARTPRAVAPARSRRRA